MSIDAKVRNTGIREEVARMARAMESQMSKNDYKQHYSHMDRSYLLNNLYNAFEKLRDVSRFHKLEDTAIAAADVANYAMMLAENDFKKLDTDGQREYSNQFYLTEYQYLHPKPISAEQIKADDIEFQQGCQQIDTGMGG